MTGYSYSYLIVFSFYITIGVYDSIYLSVLAAVFFQIYYAEGKNVAFYPSRPPHPASAGPVYWRLHHFYT